MVFLVAALAFVVALWVTPPVSVSVVGQTVDVGAVPPGPSFGLTGPGEADLFGEGPVPTAQEFGGPVRPLIVWQRFNRNDQAASFLQSGGADGGPAVTEVGDRLAAGWERYFARLVVVTGLLAGATYLMGVGLGQLVGRRVMHHHGRRRRRHAAMLAAVVVAGVALAAGSTALTVTAAARHLTDVTTLADLVGTAPLAPLPEPSSVPTSGVVGAVIGDSTAAGVGNAPLPRPSRGDTACGRSSDAYAAVLQSALNRRVLNLACGSATVREGLLGRQRVGDVSLPAQVGVLRSMSALSFVIVSVGANDVGWSEFLGYCSVVRRCDDAASDRLFRNRLDAFRIQYAQLLQQLSDLPGHPTVVVNTYYDPFGTAPPCEQLLAAGSVPPGQDASDEVSRRIDPLRSRLETLDDVLAQGADAFGFDVARPRFDGHGICAEQPWVQGLSDPAPFHPRAAGELAIAAADLPFLPASSLRTR